MTPTIGRIIHVGYLPGTSNTEALACRAAIVSGDLTHQGTLPVTVFVPNRPDTPAYVDINTGWHDPRSCPRQQAVGANDGQRVDYVAPINPTDVRP